MSNVALDGNVTDQNGAAVPGALVYVYEAPGTLASVYDSMGQLVTNPVTAGEDGYWQAFIATDKTYTLRYYWGGRERRVEANIIAGTPPLSFNLDPNLRTDLAASGGSALAGFVQSGTGAVARTVQAKQRETISITDFGALGNGAGDQTAAIQAALTYASSAMKDVFVPAGTYTFAGNLNAGSTPIRIYGVGRTLSVLRFMPTADGTALAFGNGSQVAFDQTLEDLTITSGDSTHNKTLVKLTDTSAFTMRSVKLEGEVNNGHTDYLFGGGNGSIGLEIHGREAGLLSDVLISAQRPIVIGPNPNSSIALDHFHFQDTYLLGSLGTGTYAADYPLIEVQDSPMNGTYPHWTALSNITFDGHQPWVGGGYGLYWNDTTSTGISNSLRFENVRREQSHNSTKQDFYINRTNAKLNGLTIRNYFGGQHDTDSVPGIYARKISGQLLLEAFNYAGTDGAKNAIDIDSTVENTVGIGVSVATGAAVSLAGQRKVSWLPTYPSATVPNNFVLQTTTSTAISSVSEIWRTGEVITVANNATALIGTNALIGFVLISNSVGTSAIFALTGSSNAAQEIADPSGQYSPTLGGAGVTNVAYSAGNYVIENKTGGTLSYRITRMGPGDRGFVS